MEDKDVKVTKEILNGELNVVIKDLTSAKQRMESNLRFLSKPAICKNLPNIITRWSDALEKINETIVNVNTLNQRIITGSID